MKSNWSRFLALAVIFTPSLAYAHTGVEGAAGFASGFNHPVGGFDHVLAMVAVGAWASQMGKRAVWAVPLAFVAAMLAGFVVGTMGISVPFVETGIVASVLALGVLIAASARMPLVISMAIVGLFALFHGHAHGFEMQASANGLTYCAGLLLATAALHLGGVAMGAALRKAAGSGRLLRYAGAAIALAGVYLLQA